MASSSSKVKNGIRKLFTYLPIVLVVGVGFWFAVIGPYLTRQEKNRFEAAHAELESLAEEIQTKTGPADSVNSNQNCAYASAKFSRGDRSCSINININYPDFTLTKSNEAMLDLVDIKGGKLYPGAGNMNQEKFEDSEHYRQTFSQQFSSANLLCSISYRYTDTTKLSVDPGQDVTGMIISLRCGGPARAEHYPLED